MYMYYALEWKLSAAANTPLEQTAENTYILALDGDVDFEPEAILSLMRRMKKSPMVGAACGRIHPIGSGNSDICIVIYKLSSKLHRRILTPQSSVHRNPLHPSKSPTPLLPAHFPRLRQLSLYLM